MHYRVLALTVAFLLSAAQRGGVIAPFSLVFAEPADGAAFSNPPTRIRLIFSERIDPSKAEMALIAADGSAIKLTPAIDPHLVDAVIAPVSSLKPGTYRVRWQIASARGVGLNGTYAFVFGPKATPLATDASLQAAERDGPLTRLLRRPAISRGLEVALVIAVAGLLLLRRKSSDAS